MDYETLKKQALIALGIEGMGRIGIVWMPFVILYMAASTVVRVVRGWKLTKVEVLIIIMVISLLKLSISM